MKQLIRFLFSTMLVGILSMSAFAQTTLTAVDGAAALDGVISTGEYTGQSLTTAAGVTLYAMGDGEYLYMAAQWTDATENVDKNQWTYDGTTWTKSGNEDRLALMWDMGLNGTEGASCTTMCHGTTMGTSTGMVDVWHWKAARGGTTMGVADDKHWLAETDGRHSDPGTSAYSDNALDTNGNPTYMPAGGHGMNATFLGANQAALDIMTPMTSHMTAMAVAFDPAAGWMAGDTVPGYVLRVPAGDRANVQAHGTYANGVWTVEFKKPYAGSAGDFTVVPGGSIEFSHDSFDNTGGGHTGDGTFDPTVYTLDLSSLSAASTTLAVSSGSATLDGVLDTGEWNSSALVTKSGASIYSMADGNNLYVAAQWVDPSGTENVDKNKWTYDGTTWTKSGNEDRFAFIWDMGQNGTEGASCATMCHGTTMGTSTGKVDAWHWKAARGGTTMGVVDDKNWLAEVDGRHSDPGTSAYSDNALDTNGNPTFMQTGGPSIAATFLAADQAALDIMTPVAAHPAVLATAFDPAAGWANGDTVPGYVLRVPAGDRANVLAHGKYTNGVWTVEFKKPYAGGDNDFTVTPGSTVNFTHDSFDNTGGGHSMDGTFASIARIARSRPGRSGSATHRT